MTGDGGLYPVGDNFVVLQKILYGGAFTITLSINARRTGPPKSMSVAATSVFNQLALLKVPTFSTLSE